jgi:hypothetical protein
MNLISIVASVTTIFRLDMYEVLKRGRTHNLSVECQLELFDKMVKPMLLYGSEIWK